MEQINMESSLLEEALRYLERGFSVIPVRGKRCLLPSWTEFQTRKPTKKEVKGWFFDLSPTGIAIVTGKISGIVVLDVEKDGDITGLDIPTTPTVKTGGGGWHYYFKHPGNTELKNAIRFREEMDFKADGGYIIAPPSQHKSGTRYKWLADFNKTEIADMPEWLFLDKAEKTDSNTSKSISGKSNDWQEMLLGVSEGERHDTATRLTGKLLYHFPETDWDDLVLPLLESWNEKNIPPLESEELDGIYYGLATKQSEQEKLRGYANDNKANATQYEEIDLTPVTLKNLLSAELPELRWTIEQLIPEGGLAILSAPPAHHKTWLALYFAIQVAHGDMVFDRFQTKQCNVLFVEEDTGERLITWRVQKLDPSNKNAPIKFLTRKGIKLENERTMEKLMELIKNENIGFIIFDSLIQLHNQDENVNKDMARVFKQLTKITDVGVSVLVLHHHRKESGNEDDVSWRDRSQSLRGASTMLAQINSHLVIHRQGENKSILRQAKLWEQKEAKPLEFEVADEGEKIVVRCLGEKEPDKDKKTLAKEAILESLKEEHLTRGGLVEKLKDTASTSIVASIIAELKRDREIVVVDKTGKKGRVEVYGLPDDDPDFDEEEKPGDKPEDK